MHRIRLVNPIDYYRIKQFQLRNNLKPTDSDTWNKLWFENPIKKKIGWLIENKKEIIGYLGSIIREYKINNKSIKTSCSHSFVIKKKYRYLGIILLRKFFSQKKILLFLNTSSNNEAAKIWVKLNAKKIPLYTLNTINFIPLNLKEIIKAYFKKKNIYLNIFLLNIINFFIKLIFFKKLNKTKNIIFYNDIKLVSKINYKFDIFFKEYNKNLNKIISNNNSKWLRWIYNNKIKKKMGWIYAAYKKDKIIGYACCMQKKNKYNGIKKILLTKLFALNNNRNIIKKLVSNCIIEAQKKKYHVIESIGFDKKRNNIIKSFGSFKRNFIAYPFYFKTHNSKLKNFLDKTSSWDIGFDEGDNFI